jgi:hypothetical protein
MAIDELKSQTEQDTIWGDYAHYALTTKEYWPTNIT